MANEATPSFLLLETRPRSGGDGCLYAELGNSLRVRQSPVVSNTSLSHQGEETSSEKCTNNTSLENPIVVPTSTGTPGGLPSEDSSPIRPSTDANGAGISDTTYSAPIDRLAYLRQSYASRGILCRVQASC